MDMHLSGSTPWDTAAPHHTGPGLLPFSSPESSAQMCGWPWEQWPGKFADLGSQAALGASWQIEPLWHNRLQLIWQCTSAPGEGRSS